MDRILVLAFLGSVTLCGQFDELASTDDGSRLYFSSPLGLRGMPAHRGEFRIYRVGESGVEVFAERGPLVPILTFGSGVGAHNPQVTGDGQTVGLTLSGICDPAGECDFSSGPRAELRGRNARVLGEGSLALSRNGRWALLTPATLGAL